MPFILCEILICARKFDTAERQIRELMAVDANIDGMYWYLSSALAGQGRIDEAIATQEKGVELVHRRRFSLRCWRSGTRAATVMPLPSGCFELLDGGRCSPVWLAMVYGALGDRDRAFACLDPAMAEHDDQISFMAVDHRFDSLRDDSRFDGALKKIGLPVPAVQRELA